MARITLITLGLLCLEVTIASLVTEINRAMITPAPAPQRRDTASDFIGYLITDSSFGDYYTCISPLAYTLSYDSIYSYYYAGCVGEGRNIGIECNSQWKTDALSSTISCSSYCVTNTIFYGVDDSNPATYVDCASQSTGLDFLRTEIPDAPTSEGVTFILTTILSFATSITSVPKTSTSTSSSSTPTATTSVPTPNPIKPGVIAGAVIGALVLVSLVALGLFFLFRRRLHGGRNQTPGSFGGQNNQPILAQPQMSSMNQAYISPVGFQPTYQPSPGPGSPPPIYGHNKPMNFEIQQPEYRSPDSTAEVDGISSPSWLNQPSRGGASELGTS